MLSNYIHVLLFEMRIIYSRSNGSDVGPVLHMCGHSPKHWSSTAFVGNGASTGAMASMGEELPRQLRKRDACVVTFEAISVPC